MSQFDPHEWARKNNENAERERLEVEQRWSGTEKPTEVHNQFNLLDELSRGAMYRGGEDRDTFMSGYGVGFFGGLVFLIVLYIIGSLMG